LSRPGIAGKLLGAVVMFLRVCQGTGAQFFPDAVMLVLVAHLADSSGRFFLRILIPAVL